MFQDATADILFNIAHPASWKAMRCLENGEGMSEL